MTPHALLDFFFSPYGRVARLPYIAYVLSTWLLCALAFWFLGDAIAIPLGIFLAFPAVCLAIRRWHDFNHRGWWMLLRFLPLALLFAFGPHGAIVMLMQIMPLAVLIMECVMPGTAGANRFGLATGGFTSAASKPSRFAPAAPALATVAKLAKPSRPVAKPVKPAVKAKAKAKPKAKMAKRKKSNKK